MKILFLSNNDISRPLYDFLIKDKNDVLFWDKRLKIKYLDEISPDLIISYNYRFIIRPDVIERYNEKIINLHISYLPWNKGAHPNIWSYLENTPKGVTIHYIDEGIDTGDILLQKKVEIDEKKETLSSSYDLLHKEIQELFIKNWEKIKNRSLKPKKQNKDSGNIHFMKDFDNLKDIIDENGWDITIKDLKEKVYEKGIAL